MAIDPQIPPNSTALPEPWLTGRKKLVIGIAVVALAMSYFAFQAFQGAAEYFYSVQELQAQGESLSGEDTASPGEAVARLVRAGARRRGR